ncbi:unnamed protein product [Paramecium octaurelia]|uniref:HTH myb-type domain-containing protein n=1 Tax=Paramecium octaurelia TaxID=43137 RepID=A0A8S1SIH0_PAROT|nr:unnamed protein product [Paramecium octaurelia]
MHYYEQVNPNDSTNQFKQGNILQTMLIIHYNKYTRYVNQNNRSFQHKYFIKQYLILLLLEMKKIKSYDEISFSRFQEEIGETSYENQPILIHLDDPLPSQTDSLELVLQSVPKKSKKVARKKKCDFHTKKRKKVSKKKNLCFENHTPFTFQEDEKILNLVKEHGPRFQVISKYFLDRSQNAVKNRYYKFLRYNWNLIFGDQQQHSNNMFEEEGAQQELLTNFFDNMNFNPNFTTTMFNHLTQVDYYS